MLTDSNATAVCVCVRVDDALVLYEAMGMSLSDTTTPLCATVNAVLLIDVFFLSRNAVGRDSELRSLRRAQCASPSPRSERGAASRETPRSGR